MECKREEVQESVEIHALFLLCEVDLRLNQPVEVVLHLPEVEPDTGERSDLPVLDLDCSLKLIRNCPTKCNKRRE